VRDAIVTDAGSVVTVPAVAYRPVAAVRPMFRRSEPIAREDPRGICGGVVPLLTNAT
jgi:hypothetical protein